ncbi:Glutamyl-tRNA(Gln) amidotransferase subunit B [Picochlorum sp. SENEW3]|nr:Glutamyl-tRNA(Gln) amidotransferase subunit B [Picochlorum sp. SENEW3]
MRTKESSLAEYKAWLKERWSPLVALIPEEEAEEYCRDEFNKDLKDIFLCERRVKGLNKGLGVPIRTPAEYPIRLHEVTIRFCSAGSEFSVLSDASDIIAAENQLVDVLHQHMPEEERSDDTSEDLPEYFERYCEVLFDALRFQVHETQDDPLICTFPVDLFSMLSSDVYLLLFTGLFVMHVSSIESWRQKLEILEQNLSPKLLTLLSGGMAQRHVIFVGEYDEKFDTALKLYEEEKGKKRYSLPSYVDLSQERENTIKSSPGMQLETFVEALSSTCLIPFIEERIRELEVVIGSSRRGLKNQLKTFLFRKSTSSQSSMGAFDGSEESEHSIYSQSSPQFQELNQASVEAAMRRQSDLLIMVGDYNTAISTLKLLSADLKSDKLYFHYASAQECLGVANIAQQVPPKNRRRGFHLVLAGLRYGQSNEMKLASLMHRKAIKVLDGRGWDVMEEHLHEALGQEYRDAGENAKALQHIASTVTCMNIPGHLQSHHMSHFIDLYAKVAEEMGTKSRIELDLPEFDTSHLRIISGGEHDYFDGASRDIHPRVWKEMEICFPRVPSSKILPKANKDASTNSSYAGEDILVALPVYNPLKIDIEADDLELMCSTSDQPQADSSLTCSREYQHLYPGEKTMIYLKCRPLSTGVLKIGGLRWRMGGIPCEKIFRPNISKWSIEPENRTLRGGEIEFQILPPMPRLKIELTSFPEEVNVGEVVECEIEMTNVGAISLHNITAIASPSITLSEAIVEDMKEGSEFRQYRYNFQLPVSEKSKSKLTFRAEHPGHQTVYIVWKYEPLVQVGCQPSRMLRLAKRMHALPILDLRAFLISSAETEKILLEIHNAQTNDITLNQFCLHNNSAVTSFEIQDQLDVGASQELSYGIEEGTICEDAMHKHKHLHLLANDSKYLISQKDKSPMGVLYFTSRETNREAFVVSPLSRESEEHCILGQLCGPKSLNHNFSKGPLSINLELRIQSQLHETVDACWIIGQTPKQARVTTNLIWKGEKCGMVHDIQPMEKRFIILDTLVHSPGLLQIDNIYINWNTRAHFQTGSIKIKSSFITISHVSD